MNVTMVTHSVEKDDDNDNEDKCQHNGHNDDPNGDFCIHRGAELGDNGDSDLHCVGGRRRREGMG